MKALFETMDGLKDNRNGDVITFDFDNTIIKSFLNKVVDGEEFYQVGGVNYEIIKRIKKFKDSGATVFIVTARDSSLEQPEDSVKTILKELSIEVDGVFYTNGQLKAQKLYELGSKLHYDDDKKEWEAIEQLKKTFPDFEIEVKDPNKLLKDIEAISKGVILTTDNKILIAQRSDSYEWDAPGGHIMEGEDPIFAFWRETKEELGIEISEIQYLGHTITTWKGIDKDSYYFFGRIAAFSEQIKDILDLQWEVADYFCGSYAEVEAKISGNATTNLSNVLQMLETQQDLIESYQPHSKNHKIKKRRLIGLGFSRTTGASGLKKVTDFSRSKSAPPGFGVLEEEFYSEEGSFTLDGVEYDIKKAFSIANNKKKRDFVVSDLKWVLNYDTPDPERKKNADLDAPIMVAKDALGRLTVVDGLHRLAKAVEAGKKQIQGVLFSEKELESMKIDKSVIKIKIKR